MFGEVLMNLQKIKQNRKASTPIAITIMVFLILALTSSSLWLFASSTGKVKLQVSKQNFVDELIYGENLESFYISQEGEGAIIKSYKEIAAEGKYGVLSNQGVVFGELSKNLNLNMEKSFRKNFKKDMGKAVEDFEISFDGDNFLFETRMLFEISKEKIKATYNSILTNEFNLRNLGLESFQKIYETKEKCIGKSVEETKSCYGEDLKNFEVGVQMVSDLDERFIVTLISKKEFFVDGNFEKISFSFIPEDDPNYFPVEEDAGSSLFLN